MKTLPETMITERFEAFGITCQTRRDPRPDEEIRAASRLCDQRIVQLALELDGRASPDHTLTVRTRNGETLSRWRNYFGGAQRTFPNIPSIDTLRPLMTEFAKEVAERRRAMGKT